jgi:vancomycin resistance protein YoaR
VLQPAIDGEALLAATSDQLAAIGREPRDASVSLSGGTPVVQPAQDGQKPDTTGYADAVLAAAAGAGDARVVPLPLVVQPASFTTEQAASSGVSQVVAEFTTYYPHADYRNQNIGRAAELANNTFLKPGDTFSMNDVVGERTEARGFTKGFIIDDGRFQEGVGGGVSQLATTLFNAGHFAGFEDVEHHAHSFYIDRYPMGREATVSWGSWDMRFKNNTPYGAVVQAFITPSSPGVKGAVTVRIWSTPYWQVQSSTGSPSNFTDFPSRELSGPGCVPSAGSRGFDVVVTRSLSRNGAVADTEEIFTRYQPTPQVTCT